MNSRKYNEKFGCLSCAKRVWAVASIHGEADALKALHDEIARRWMHGDRLVYLGNYLGRGRAVREVLDELLSFRINRLCLPGMMPEDIVFLRGAQEEIWRGLLQIQLAPQPASLLDWMVANDVGATLEAYGESVEDARRYIREGTLAMAKWTNRLRDKVRAYPGHNDIFIALRRAAYTEGGELLFVHAGLDPDLPVIGFPKGVGANIIDYVKETGVTAVSLDTGTPLHWAAQEVQSLVPVQGNLDPLLLVEGGAAMERRIAEILETLGKRPFIFNLGHGIVPQTPPENVARLAALIRGE